MLFAALLVLAVSAAAAPFSTNAPEQIHLSLGRSPSVMVVSWVTPSAANSSVQIGTQPGKYWNEFVGSSDNYTVGTYQSGSLHTTTIVGLSAATKYYYRCGDAKGVWSSEYSFTTAPTEKVPVNFGILGDLGLTANSQNTVNGLLSNPDGIDLILHAGDLSYANGWQPTWDSWGKMIQPMAAKTAWMVGVGNHENYYNFVAFNKRFTMPATGSMNGGFYYAFTYSYARIIWMSTETDYSSTSPQYTWIKQELSTIDRTQTPWVIMIWHRPFYSSNTAHQGEAAKFKTLYEDLFFQYKVDLVFNGHVHAYERSKPVYKDKVNPNGPIYMTIGDGGNAEGLADQWLTQPVWSAFRKAQYGYVHARMFNETTIHWQWYVNPSSKNTNEVQDDLYIVRPYPRI